MQIRTQDEVIQRIEEITCEILDQQKLKKSIDEDIAAIKQTAKEEGIAISVVMKMVSRIKAREKMSEADKLEEDIIEENLTKSERILDKIAELNS